MARPPLRVLVLYDLPELVSEHDDPRYLIDHSDRPTERDVVRAIKRLSMELHVHGVFNDMNNLISKVSLLKPDVIFNLCETYRGNRSHEGDIASILELSGFPYTGSRPAALHLCKDKGTTKKIADWDDIRVPAFKMFGRDDFTFEAFDAKFPLIVKPLDREASEGISQASIVHDWTACEERASWVASKLKSDVIVEEYIHGREVYVGVVNRNGVIETLPTRELFFENLDKDEPMVATYRAKWDDNYRARWGISTGSAANLSKLQVETLSQQSIKIFKSLGLQGYARIDWRIAQDGAPVFLEANPNPALSHDDDFAKAAKSAGISYQELIAHIIAAALVDHQSLDSSSGKQAS